MVETILRNHRYLAMEKASDKGHHPRDLVGADLEMQLCVCVCGVYVVCVSVLQSGAILVVSSHIVTTERR